MALRCDIPTKTEDIILRQGRDECITITFTDENGDGVDLTGFTIAGQVRQGFPDTSPALTFTPDNTGAANGVFLLTASVADIANMPAGTYADDQTRADVTYGVYDAEITDGTYVYRVAEGKVTLSREATQ